MPCCVLAWRFSSKFYSRGAGIGIAVAVTVAIAVAIIFMLLYNLNTGASCKACFCIHRFCPFSVAAVIILLVLCGC